MWPRVGDLVPVLALLRQMIIGSCRSSSGDRGCRSSGGEACIRQVEIEVVGAPDMQRALFSRSQEGLEDSGGGRSDSKRGKNGVWWRPALTGSLSRDRD